MPSGCRVTQGMSMANAQQFIQYDLRYRTLARPSPCGLQLHPKRDQCLNKWRCAMIEVCRSGQSKWLQQKSRAPAFAVFHDVPGDVQFVREELRIQCLGQGHGGPSGAIRCFFNDGFEGYTVRDRAARGRHEQGTDTITVWPF
jgi:hypothetical protein